MLCWPPSSLDDEFSFVTGEVREVRADRGLTAEVCAFDFQGAKVLPERALSVGDIAAEATGVLGSIVGFAHCQKKSPTPDPSPPLAALAGGGERQRHSPEYHIKAGDCSAKEARRVPSNALCFRP